MTSLQFFRSSGPNPHYNPPNWGTGGPKDEKIEVSVPRNASWRYSGKPITQYYDKTLLKRSHVRVNDELIPKPEAVDIGKEAIDLPFPAEHPYSGHIPKFAVFPKFDSPEDYKRGVAARKEQPISSEMPANPAEIIIKQKIKGEPYRHEFQDMPVESERTALYWPGEDFFDQQAKVHGHRQQFFPTPPKTMCPNLQDRKGDMKVGPRTANALRNVERDQWMTRYQLEYTGLGPANPMNLDNLEEKRRKLFMTGVEDDKLDGVLAHWQVICATPHQPQDGDSRSMPQSQRTIPMRRRGPEYPHTQNTLDPPRPLEGRLPAKCHPVPIHSKSMVTETLYDSNYSKESATRTEQEEHRLLYGADYINLPDTYGDPNRDLTWQELDTAARAGPCLEKVEEAKQQQGQRMEEPHPPTTPPPPPAPGAYMQKLKTDWDHGVQQVEAQNRWKVLEAQTPSHDRTALNIKMARLPNTDKPAIFYGHEGRYNEERAGLYKTSYDPHSLTWSMTAESQAPSELTNTLHSNIQSQFMESLPAARLNEDVNAALKWSRTFSLSKPELSGDRRDGPEVMQTYNKLKSRQQQVLLPPEPQDASPRVQERELVEQEDTTMGQGYNTKKFLQDNNIRRHARNEPYLLMSNQNQNLERVRAYSIPRPSKNVHFSKSVTVATIPETTSPIPPILPEVQPLNMADLPDHAPPLYTETNTRPPSARYVIPKDQDLQREPSNLELRHSAPPKLRNTTSSPNTNTTTTTTTERHVYFSDENNNAGGDPAETCRSFPVRPGASHGHGLTDSEYTDRYRVYKSVPTGLRNHPQHVPCPTQVQVFDLGYKKDERFNWQPGCGVPRIQSKLLKMQDSFDKSEVRKKFHGAFPEDGPQLRLNISKGRRHEFWGYNSRVLHG